MVSQKKGYLFGGPKVRAIVYWDLDREGFVCQQPFNIVRTPNKDLNLPYHAYYTLGIMVL